MRHGRLTRTYSVFFVFAFVFFFCIGISNAVAQIPRSISYQGLLEKNAKPVTGSVDLRVKIYDAAGQTLYDEFFNQVNVANGIYDVLIGGKAGILPPSLKFDEQYYMGVEVNNSGEIIPRTPLVSVPYSFNSQTVGGFGVSSIPKPGMLLPLDISGKLPRSVLPETELALHAINDVSGDQNGKITIVSGDTNTLSVSEDVPNNKIILTAKDPSQLGIVTANRLAGSGLNKYSGVIPIPHDALIMAITYTGVTSTSTIIATISDPAGQTDQVSIGEITPGVGFTVIFSGFYPTTTGKLNYLVIN
jgi:hypothetical protein